MNKALINAYAIKFNNARELRWHISYVSKDGVLNCAPDVAALHFGSRNLLRDAHAVLASTAMSDLFK